jgi:hypothetical protein
MTGDESLRDLIDKQAIHELVASYCRAIDRRDYALLRSLYHEQAIEDRGAIFSGTAAEFVDFVQADAGNYEITSHRLFNEFYAVDGDFAEGEIYCEAYHRTAGEESMEVIAGGRYLDRYEKRGGKWKFLFRTSTVDRCEVRPVNRDDYRQFVAGAPAGTPDASDPSYRVLSLLARHQP